MRKKIIWIILCILSFAYIYWIAGLIGVSVLVMIALHELGHLYMAKYLGYQTGGFVFIPGLGGVALLKEPVKTFWDGFLIWFAGPFSGLVQVVIVMGINYFIQSQFIWQMAVVWAFVNLFNLLPVIPLDGGQMFWCIGNSIHKAYGEKWLFMIFQFIGLMLISLITGIIWVIIIILFGWETIVWNRVLLPTIIPMNWKKIFFSILLYFLLFGALCVLIALGAIMVSSGTM